MKRSGIVNLSHSKFVDTVLKNNVVIILAVFFIVGVVIGVMSLGNNDTLFSITKNEQQLYAK